MQSSGTVVLINTLVTGQKQEAYKVLTNTQI